METRAKIRHIHISAQKARLVIDQIRGKKLEEALSILALSNKAIAGPISKVVSSAAANAENNNDMDIDKLYVKTAFVDRGPSAKRMRARAQGRSNVIKKRTSHITVVLDELQKGG